MLKLKGANAFINTVRHSSFSYKALPDESKKLIDRILRVDQAGTFHKTSKLMEKIKINCCFTKKR